MQKNRSRCPTARRRENASINSLVEPLEQRLLMSANLIANGDFSRGTAGFSTAYNKGGTSLVPTDTYAVGLDPHLYHYGGAEFGDHTTGTGKMLMVNGSPKVGTVLWKEAVKVAPGVVYSFNGWASSWATDGTDIGDISPAQVQVTINGKVISSTKLPTTPGQWTQLTGTWLATAGRATITITDLNIDVGGNDSAYDDLSFISLASIHGSLVSASVNAKGRISPRHKPLAGITLFLDTNDNGVLDAGELTALTSKSGVYVFTGLTAGNYTICQANPPDYDLPAAELKIDVPTSKQLLRQNLIDLHTALVPTVRIFR